MRDDGAWLWSLELGAMLGFWFGLVCALVWPDTDGPSGAGVRRPGGTGRRGSVHKQAYRMGLAHPWDWRSPFPGEDCPCVDCVAERARVRVMERAFGKAGGRKRPSASAARRSELLADLETRVASDPRERRWRFRQVVELPVMAVSLKAVGDAEGSWEPADFN